MNKAAIEFAESKLRGVLRNLELRRAIFQVSLDQAVESKTYTMAATLEAVISGIQSAEREVQAAIRSVQTVGIMNSGESK